MRFKISRNIVVVNNRTGDIIELFLNETSLNVLPAEIGMLKHLKWLEVAGNNLNSVPVEISHLVNLRDLDLSNNNIKSIPDKIKQLESLSEFSRELLLNIKYSGNTA